MPSLIKWPSGSGEEDENVKSLQTEGYTNGWRTGDQKSSLKLSAQVRLKTNADRCLAWHSTYPVHEHISLTISSDLSALSLISLILENSSCIAFWASSKASLPSSPAFVCPRTTDRISSSSFLYQPSSMSQ